MFDIRVTYGSETYVASLDIFQQVVEGAGQTLPDSLHDLANNLEPVMEAVFDR